MQEACASITENFVLKTQSPYSPFHPLFVLFFIWSLSLYLSLKISLTEEYFSSSNSSSLNSRSFSILSVPFLSLIGILWLGPSCLHSRIGLWRFLDICKQKLVHFEAGMIWLIGYLSLIIFLFSFPVHENLENNVMDTEQK